MSKAPSMPMFWDAYLADTTHLTCEEHGAYLLMLAAMWRRNGFIPDNDKDNARILGLTIGKYRKMKGRLSEFLKFENGQITQENLQKIWKKTQEKIEKNSQNGAKGGRPKGKENKDLAKANGSNSLNPNESIPKPEPNISKDIKKTKAKKEFEILVEVIGEDRANSVIEHRKFLKKPLTERAAKLLANEFSKTKDPKEAADLMVMNGWQGFKASWAKGDTPNQPASISQQPKPMGIAEMAMHQANQLKAEGR